MNAGLTREEALALLKKYNKDPFHIQHAFTVEAVMKWYAQKLGYGEEAEFWGIVGLLHDIDFELYPLTDADTIYVAILEPNQSFEDAIIRKVITKDSPTDTENHPLLRLSSADTEFLRTGKYFITIIKSYKL